MNVKPFAVGKRNGVKVFNPFPVQVLYDLSIPVSKGDAGDVLAVQTNEVAEMLIKME